MGKLKQNMRGAFVHRAIVAFLKTPEGRELYNEWRKDGKEILSHSPDSESGPKVEDNKTNGQEDDSHQESLSLTDLAEEF